jgi:hypothetical protein
MSLNSYHFCILSCIIASMFILNFEYRLREVAWGFCPCATSHLHPVLRDIAGWAKAFLDVSVIGARDFSLVPRIWVTVGFAFAIFLVLDAPKQRIEAVLVGTDEVGLHSPLLGLLSQSSHSLKLKSTWSPKRMSIAISFGFR